MLPKPNLFQRYIQYPIERGLCNLFSYVHEFFASRVRKQHPTLEERIYYNQEKDSGDELRRDKPTSMLS